jgi:hypothetical protein
LAQLTPKGCVFPKSEKGSKYGIGIVGVDKYACIPDDFRLRTSIASQHGRAARHRFQQR